jgi:hypothetical protein
VAPPLRVRVLLAQLVLLMAAASSETHVYADLGEELPA